MTTQSPFKRLTKYELKNLFGNWYIPFFGLIFPVFMSIIISKGALKSVPDEYYQDAVTSVVCGMSQMIALASVFLGTSSIYSTELEKRIPVRMELFGFTAKQMIGSRLVAQIIFMVLALTVHFGVLYPVLDYKLPSVTGALIFILFFFIESIALYLLAYGIANFIRKFGPAYGVSMGVYFGFMILGGMMGISKESLPGPLRTIGNLLPFGYYSDPEIVKLWTGNGYAYGPLIQSLLFLLALGAIVLIASVIYRRKHAFA